MAWVFDTGVSPTAGVTYTSAEWAWLLKELLKSVGWEIQASSDGTNVSNTPGNANDQITSLAEMNTNNAWYVIKQPTIARGWGRKGGRQFIIRRGTTATSWLVVYVPLDAAEAAQSPTASGTTTAVPTFTTSHALLGTLPDTAASLGFSGGSGSQRLLIGANDEAPYAFFVGAWDSTGSPVGGTVLFDPLEPDSVDANDEDPYVVACHTTNPWDYTAMASLSTGARAYYRKGLTGESFSYVGGAFYGLYRSATQIAIPRDIGKSPYNKKEKLLPVWYMRGSTDGASQFTGLQIKGTSSVWRWSNGARISGIRLTQEIQYDRIILGDCVLPWDPSVTPYIGA